MKKKQPKNVKSRTIQVQINFCCKKKEEGPVNSENDSELKKHKLISFNVQKFLFLEIIFEVSTSNKINCFQRKSINMLSYASRFNGKTAMTTLIHQDDLAKKSDDYENNNKYRQKQKTQ